MQQKSADISKIWDHWVPFLFFLVDFMKYYNFTKFQLIWTIFKDFSEGGRNPPPLSITEPKKAQ